MIAIRWRMGLPSRNFPVAILCYIRIGFSRLGWCKASGFLDFPSFCGIVCPAKASGVHEYSFSMAANKLEKISFMFQLHKCHKHFPSVTEAGLGAFTLQS
jgi:hypothetical protein